MINVVIPAAGLGRRFLEAGYTEPKFFLDIQGKMMIERCMEGIQLSDGRYIVVIQEAIMKRYAHALHKLKEKYGMVDIVTVDRETQGAACTVLAALREINNDEMLVVVDSDVIFENGKFQEFVDRARVDESDGMLLTFHSVDARYSYVKKNKEGYVKRTEEKSVVSNMAIAGAYTFKKGSSFVECAVAMLIHGDLCKGEYYMSNVYNWGVKRGMQYRNYMISGKAFHCVGTPEQMQEYMKTLLSV